jgi:uncharacterized protein YjbI with pentapeptide repeats
MKNLRNATKEINIRIKRLSNIEVIVLLVGTGVLSEILSKRPDIADWARGFLQNFSTEMLGAFVTFLLLQLIVASRQEREQLSHDMASAIEPISKHAIEVARRNNWLYDGSLRGGKLIGANWPEINLETVDLQDAILIKANLQKAHLYRTNLKQANLMFVNLEEGILHVVNLDGAKLHQANLQKARLETSSLKGAILYGANLQGAMLSTVNLQRGKLQNANLNKAIIVGADLRKANLACADLRGADLRLARLEGAIIIEHDEELRTLFDEDTLLPNETHWTPDTDMACFTNPKHPNYYKPPKI